VGECAADGQWMDAATVTATTAASRLGMSRWDRCMSGGGHGRHAARHYVRTQRRGWPILRYERDESYIDDRITADPDVRLFTTLARFDAVYHGHFKCNRDKLTEMPVLWAYARDLFQTPGFGDTIDFEQIKRHYYWVLDQPDAGGSGRPRRLGLGHRPLPR
jgi:hypothetical protein